VTNGLAGVKFSGSFNRLGDRRTMLEIKINKTIKPVISFVEK